LQITQHAISKTTAIGTKISTRRIFTDDCDDGWSDGTLDGSLEGWGDGTLDGTLDGSLEGWGDGTLDGWGDGTLDGSLDGSLEGWGDGVDATNVKRKKYRASFIVYYFVFFISRLLTICSNI
jgi:hypothetical protein